ATITNAVSGSTSGALTLVQNAAGGSNGGVGGGSTIYGNNGNGASSLTFSQTGMSSLTGYSNASGGNGNNGDGTPNVTGGNANASINLSTNTTVNANATANGGAGNAVDNTQAGTGGAAIANAQGANSGTAAGASGTSVSASAGGGGGGYIGNGGGLGGNGGNGGAATATATGFSAGPDSFNVTAFASGGGGNAGANGTNGSFVSGNGGNAIATATGTGSGAAQVNVEAHASGGGGGPNSNGATAGHSGSATANATAITTGVGGYAIAQSFSAGSSGTSTADARASGAAGSAIALARGVGTVPVDGDGPAEGRATIGQSLPVSSGVSAAAFAEGMPLASDTANAWASSSNVQNVFGGNTANVHGLGFTELQVSSLGAGTSHTYSSVIEFTEDASALSSSSNLAVGLVGSALTGTGLGAGDSLRFRIVRAGSTLVDQTFSTNAAAQSYFANSAFNLGVSNAGLGGGNLDLQFLFDLTSSHVGNGIGAQVVSGITNAAPGAVWNNANGGTWVVGGNWTGNTVPDGPGLTVTFGNVISSPKTVTLDQSNTVGTISFPNTVGYTIAQGTPGASLIFDNGGAAATVLLSGFGGVTQTISAPVVLPAAGLNINLSLNSQTLALTGNISGSGGINNIGSAGTLLLGGTNTFTGGVSASAGVIQISSDANLGAVPISPTTNMTFSGAELLATASLTTNANRNITLSNSPGPTSATLDGQGSGITLTIGGNISGSGPLTKGPSGNTVVLLGNNTYAGTTTIGGGILQVGNGGTFGSLPAGNIADNATLVINRSDAVSMSNNISGTGALTKSGAGTLTLNAVNTYTGATTLIGGTLAVPAAASLASASITVAGGTTFNVDGSLASTAAVFDGGTTNFAGNTSSATTLTRSLSSLSVSTGALAKVNLSSSAIVPEIFSPTTLTITGTGKLDLGNNELKTAALLSDIRTLVNNGGIFTTHTSTTTGLGYASQGGGIIEVRYTLLGDANLSGGVDVGDLGALATNYGTTTGAFWSQGDFNKDGAVNVGDLGALATNYGISLAANSEVGAPAAMIAAPTASASAAVPEPSSAVIILAAATALLPARRRRRSHVKAPI
ncbi:MAG TPA: autotransporter-associated beta strand repeat-containing protein, partial [Tepidisphaeraceae bacterium]|nr:autotransporter-associated beta strand repeat-containing protein [Tepidisphaeraceae bacterium]